MAMLMAQCSCCGSVGEYELSEKEAMDVTNYLRGDLKGYLQNLFPNIPPWIRSGAIDVRRTNGFCTCPTCQGFESEVE